MATLTLRRAAQVYNRILTETQFEASPEAEDPYGYNPRRRRGGKKQTFVTSATVTADGDPRQRADQLREALLEKKIKIFRLMTIGTQIRQAVAAKQADCGVTALVTERVAVVQKQKILDNLVNLSEVDVYEPNTLVAQAAAIRQRLSVAGNGSMTDTITTSLLTASDRVGFQKELGDVRRRLLEIDDRLAELNSTNSVTVLDERDYQYLRELGIA